MNVSKEVRAANQRVQAGIDRSARAALDRINQRTPTEEREYQEALARVSARVSPMEAMGRLARAWEDAMQQMAADFQRGYKERSK